MVADVAARRTHLVSSVLALAAALFSGARALSNRAALEVVLGSGWHLLLAVLAVALAATLAELVSALRARTADFVPARLAFAAIVAGWLIFVGAVQPFQRLWFDVSLGLQAAIWAALVRIQRASPSRAARALERTLFLLALVIALLEMSLRAAARVFDSPLLARAHDSARANIARFRCAPGLMHQSFACNSRGFFDAEFARRAAGTHLVAAIGDSFNVGAVPHAHHYTTVAERALGIPIANIGVAGAGPREYAALLFDEMLALDPDAIVISIFVGNDLAAETAGDDLPDRALRAWYSRDRALLFLLPARLARLAHEPALAPRTAGDVPAAELDLARRFPWLDDPWRETPTLSEAAFLRLESQRALDVCRGDPPALESALAALDAMRRASGARAFVVMLVPDEFQVEDELWRAVEARAGVPLERDRAQRVLRARLARSNIDCLDLLPSLRALEPLADGRRHAYHLRDTHFNARGNRAAGEALAAFLAERLPR